jgi:glucose/arabinose dehydrogenase
MLNVFDFFLALLLILPATAVPVGFVDEGVATITAIKGVFAPNPRLNGKPMLVLSSKEGTINVLEDPDTSDVAIKVADLNSILCTNGPRGLLNIIPHPDFASNRYIFMYYSRIVANCPEDLESGPSNRLSRFTMNAVTLQIDLRSEVVVLETPPSPVALHDGGAMAFGNDGLLYLAIGDGGLPRHAPDLRNLYGKMVRLDINGNVPRSNPFTVASGGTGVSCRRSKGRPLPTASSDAVCEEIYAYGFRNPYRIGLDMNTKDKVRFAIGDVGLVTWEEVSYGGTDYKGTNYGWSTFEGPCTKNTINDCPLQGGGATEPFHYYQHVAAGGAITGFTFVPNGVWPTQYKQLLIDYITSTIYNLVEDQGKACRTCKPPISAFRNETFHRINGIRMVDLFFGPYKNSQAMYYIHQSGGQNVRRIRYTSNSNRSPKAVIFLARKGVVVNEVIPFIGSNSSDPDGDTLTFLWNFGDGRTSTKVNPLLSYSRLGQFQVTLTVTDTSGQKSQAFVLVVVGTPPTLVIETPRTSNGFNVGERLRLKGRATNSSNMPIPDTQIFWEVRLRHASHFHPFLDKKVGNNFDTSPAPRPEDLTAATNSYLVVSMTAVDSNGISNTISRDIFPRKVTIDIVSRPPGLQVLVDDTSVVTPRTITSWQNHNLGLEVRDQGRYVFTGWSIGGNRIRTYNVPAANGTNPKIIATFTAV